MLIKVPVHIFVFDARLICRFAAPYGPAFLGRTNDQFVSAPALEIFARVSAIVPRLLQVTQTGVTWAHPSLAYPADPAGQWPAGVWQVHMQPWDGELTEELLEEQGQEAAAEELDGGPAANGVLVCCAPIEQESGSEPASAAAEWHAEGRRSAQLIERIRTKLTVIRGNVELFTRRELRAGGPLPLELVRVTAAVDDAERLLREYERSSRLITRHPNLS
jgi:signal transduction histidine kinase